MADNTIDSLVLEISSNSQGAEKALDKLAGSLEKLSKSMNFVSNMKFGGFNSAMENLKKSLTGFSGVGNLEKGITQIQRLSRLNADGLLTTAIGLGEVSTALKGMNGISIPNLDGLEPLISNIRKFGGKNIGNATKNLPIISRDLVNFVSELNRVKSISFDFTGLNNLVQNVSNLGLTKAVNATKNMKTLKEQLLRFISGLNGIKKLDFDVTGLNELVTALSKLGYSAALKAPANIKELADSLKYLLSTLSKAPAVSQNVIQITQSLAQLAAAGGRAGTASRSLVASFNSLPSSTGKARKGFSGLAGAIGKFYATYWLLIRAMGGFRKAIDISSDLTEVQNVVDVTFGEMADTMNDFADSALQNYGMSELMAKQIASRFQAMGVSMGFAQGKMSEMSIELTKLTGDMASFYNESQESVAKALQSIFTGETEPMRRFGLDLSFATVEAWALANGLEADMQKMTQAEKTMLRYQYVLANTGAASGDFLRTINSWHNQLVLLAGGFQQLGSIVGGVLINAFKPFIQALNSVMGAVINFAQVVSDALGAIFGWEYQTGGGVAQDLEAGAGAAQDIEDATGGAADNAKKLNKYIAGWHEVNNMTSDSKDKGSGGAGMGDLEGLGDADGGKWIQKESLWEKYTSDIDSLYELGDYISGVLTDAMNSIDWDKVYESARGFGSGLASFLNGLISPKLFGATGRTIAGALNTAIYAALSFGENFAWKNFGQSIYTGVNEFFKTFDFASLADTINVWAKGILDAFIFALDRIDWELIGTQIGMFLEKIDFFDIGKKIGIALWKAINGGINIAKSMFDIAPVETAILTAFVGIMAFNTITGVVAKTIGKLAIFIAPLKSMFITISSFFSSGGIFSATGPIAAASAPILALAAAFAVLVAGLGTVFATNEQVRNSFATAVLTIQEGLTPVIQFMTNTLLPGLNNGWNELLNILKPLGEFLEQVFTDIWIKVLNPALEYIGKKVLPMLSDTFNNVWNNVLVPFGEFLSSVLSPAIEMLSSVLTFLWKNVGIPLIDFLGGIFTAHFEGIVAIFNNFVVPAVNKMIDVFQFLWNNVFIPIGDFLQNNFQPRFETAFNVISGIIDGFGTSLRGLIQFITGTFSGDWKTAWQGVENIFKGIFNGIISIAEGAVNFIIDSLNKLSFDIPDWVPEFGGETFGFDIEKVKLPRLAKGGIVSSPTIALIGESGSEAVIPIERNTKWISKVADTMSNEFGKYRLNTYVPQPDFSPTSYDLGKFRSTMQMEMDAKMAEQQWEIRKQNELLREQNELLRGIYNKPLLSDADVFNSARRGQHNFNRRTFRTGWAGID